MHTTRLLIVLSYLNNLRLERVHEYTCESADWQTKLNQTDVCSVKITRLEAALTEQRRIIESQSFLLRFSDPTEADKIVRSTILSLNSKRYHAIIASSIFAKVL